MEELIYKYLGSAGYIKESAEEIAINKINLQNKEVIISGNKLGLIMLADYLVEIALSDKDYTHVHLDIDNFFDESNVDLIVSKHIK